MNAKEKLKNLLQTIKPKEELKKWVKGYIPSDEAYIRNSIPKEERFELAKIGFTEFYLNFGIELYYTQSLVVGAFISGKYKTGRLIATPRYGKSMIEGGLAVWLAINSYHTAVVADKSFRTKKVMEHARKELREGRNFLKEHLIEDDKQAINEADYKLSKAEIAYSKERIVFKNGNKIETKTTGDSFTESNRSNATIGDGTHVIIDEMDFLSEDSLTELARREFEADDGNKLILFGVSNPRFNNHFKKSVENPELAKDEFVIRMNVRTAIEEGNIKMSPEEVVQSDFAKNEASIMTNLLCEYQQTTGKFFNDTLQTDSKYALNKINKETIAVLGIDSAYSGNDNIAVCLQLFDAKDDAPIKVIDIANLRPKEWNNKTSTHEIVDKIVQLSKIYPVKAIATDVGQGSHIIVDIANRKELRSIKQYSVNFASRPTQEKIHLNVDSAVLARNKRAEMHLALRQLIYDKKIIFSDDISRILSREMELVDIKQQTNATDKITLIEKNIIKRELGHSPDSLDAVLLATHALELYLLGIESR